MGGVWEVEGGKSNTSKVLVVMAVEMLAPKGFRRIRLRRVANDSAACVILFIQDVIEPGAQVRTDGSGAYLSLKDLGFVHQHVFVLLKRGFTRDLLLA